MLQLANVVLARNARSERISQFLMPTPLARCLLSPSTVAEGADDTGHAGRLA